MNRPEKKINERIVKCPLLFYNNSWGTKLFEQPCKTFFFFFFYDTSSTLSYDIQKIYIYTCDINFIHFDVSNVGTVKIYNTQAHK